jgi:uncharacterized membrane protein
MQEGKMASTPQRPATAGDWLKPGFFALLGLCFVAVLWVDDRFWFDPADPHSRRIFAYRSLLMFHGLAGLTALIAGTLQMSGRIRTRNPALHRALGILYLLAVGLSAPVAIYVGVSTLEPASIRVEQVFQGGLWLGCALLAWVCARMRQMPLHRDWMIRSYGFTLVFVLSRVPDLVYSHYSDQFLSDMLWALLLCALGAPEVISTVSAIARAALRKRAV